MSKGTDATQTTLEPCPFCGGCAELGVGEFNFHSASIRCSECGAESGTFDVDDGAADELERNSFAAVAAWNRRV